MFYSIKQLITSRQHGLEKRATVSNLDVDVEIINIIIIIIYKKILQINI